MKSLSTSILFLLAAASVFAQDTPQKNAQTAQTAQPGASPAARPSMTVTVVQPQSAVLPVKLMANGNVAAWQEAIIGAEINGLRVTEIRADVGSTVRRGQVLAVLQNETIEAEAAQARAAVAEAEAALAEARVNAGRARAIQGEGAFSEQQIAQWLTAEKTAEARLAAQRAMLNQHLLRLKYTRVTASDDGIVSARLATLGAVAAQGQEMFRLIRQSRLEWRAEVTSADLSRIRQGQAVSVRAGGANIAGRVRLAAPTVDAQTRNAMVYVDLPGAFAAGLRPGMFTSGEFQIDSAPGLVLPQAAVVARDGFQFVFVMDAVKRVKLTKVQIGRRDGANLEVLSGVTAAQTVVVSGAAFLADGDTVRVNETKVAPGATRK